MSTGNETPPAPQTIQASEFQSQCLKLLDEVAETGKEIIITKNGKPVAMLTPYREQRITTPRKKAKSMYGADKGKIGTFGDIVSPMPAEWFADSDDPREVIS